MDQLTVKAWEEEVIIPTYGIGKPDKNPMFFEKRVYQGSSGVVYPHPVIEKIFDEKEDKSYRALFLENEYLKIMLLPELGGRVQMAFDKIKQRHFVYYNQVIKPALVGLTGPWISGGIEFNWPQHHRPSTYEPVDYKTITNQDGSATVWINEVEKMFRTKGMAAFTLHPGKAYLEIKAHIFNRSNLPQTFLWWANPAVKVNDHYQSVFPPDVNAVLDHGKRDVSTFPIATGTYYKVDYSPGTDISRYKNIPVPTSYMAINSAYDFVGGYEHDTQAGMLHVANHHVSPGKKQWTWGHGDFGQAWDRNLTDEDGPYIELMAGCFTDNQPDFTWLMPYEQKTFTQYFLPYRELGVVKNASRDVLISVQAENDLATIKVQATSVQKEITIVLKHKDEVLFNTTADLSPEQIFSCDLPLEGPVNADLLALTLTDRGGNEVIAYDPAKNELNDIPEPAKAALPPAEVSNNEQLFLTGQHLEQYRHATYNPVDYYQEALKRDAGDYRCNNALGLYYLRRGQFAQSGPYFKTAIATVIARNPNPYDGEAYYNLGLSLKYQLKLNEAYHAFYKATWSNAFQDIGFFSVAQIDLINAKYQQALTHIEQSLSKNAANGKAYVLKSAAQRHLGAISHAIDTSNTALQLDRFNLGAIAELMACSKLDNDLAKLEYWQQQLVETARDNENNYIEYALDYASAGLFTEAVTLLSQVPNASSPMVYYHLAYFSHQLNDEVNAGIYLTKAAQADPYLCFPNFLEDILALQYAITTNQSDAMAPYYLGNLWYDKRQYNDAISAWEISLKRNDKFPTTHRNLAIAYFNKKNDPSKALHHFEHAFDLDETDARVLMELDQLYKRLNVSPAQRLRFLEQHNEVASQRDDLYLEIASLYNFSGDNRAAFQMIMKRQFHPWEGGEGKVSGQYVLALVEIAKQLISQHKYSDAIGMLEQTRKYPHNIGEGKLHGARENDLLYYLGCAHNGLNDQEAANRYWRQATAGSVEPGAAMFYNDQQPDQIFYQALAYQKLNEHSTAGLICNRLISYGAEHLHDDVKLDYFAVSLPNLLIFDDDLNTRNQIHCYYLMGLGHLGLNEFDKAKELLSKVLEMDAMHFGARVHLDMAEASVESGTSVA